MDMKADGVQSRGATFAEILQSIRTNTQEVIDLGYDDDDDIYFDEFDETTCRQKSHT